AGLGIALVFGIVSGAILLIADLFFLPYWPQPLIDTAKKTTLMENFLASFYGGINEEILMRLFLFSTLVWLSSYVVHASAFVFWSINVAVTILFGLGHLPALKQAVGTLPRLMIIRSLLLNAPIGLVCGWLFWTYGIEAAMLAHFSAD